jgi:Zn finger protein HypA/HybF involved in hydrogenase expression
MKTCPNCQSEIEENFDVCWNCNYSISEEKIITFKESAKDNRKIDCLRCNIPLIYSGEYKFHEGTRTGLLGNVFELFINREKFDLYICPKCGKVEFYSPR